MTKGCYTCRRRRIVCDNGLPTCRKCRGAGKECLGYQKPLVWVKGGVASRGKMMGRSFDDWNKVESHSNGDTAAQRGSSAVSDDRADILSLEPEWHRDLNYAVQRLSGSERPGGDDSLVDTDNSAAAGYLPSPWGLIDPLFKDLNPLSRFYIYHFNEHMVDTLILYPGIRNPYRDLTTFAGDSPALAHAFSAMGALHYALISHEEFSPAPWSSNGPNAATLSLKELESVVTNAMARRPASKVYKHFLAFKQRALGQLSLDVCDPARQNDDRTVAAILVLTLLDTMESGGGAWKYHLEGAKNLLKCREYGCPSGHPQEIMNSTFGIDGCLMFQLMGSTLSRPGTLSKPFYSSSMGPAILKRLEQTSWVGCPAYLLEVIFFVHTQWYQDTDPATAPQPSMASTPIQSGAAVLQHIQAFNPIAWAEEMQSCVYLPDLSPRITLATIYKAAVYLYASRVLSRPRSAPSAQEPTASAAGTARFTLPPDHKPTVDALVHQLSLFPREDPHLKSLFWPTFIAGAESTDPSHRPVILHLLSMLFYIITAFNVRNAAWVLSLMWRKQDLRREEAAGLDDTDFDWIRELDDTRIDWLFI